MREAVEQAYALMPFRSELSFNPLYRKARELYESSRNKYSREVGNILSAMEAPGGLLDSFSEEHPEMFSQEIAFLMSLVFPELEDGAICKALRPFTHDHFYSSARYKELFEEPGIELELSESLQMQLLTDFTGENLLFAYTMLFDIYHELEHEMMEAVMKMPDSANRVDRYFLADYSFRFVEVDAAGLKILPREQFSRLLIMRDRENLERLMPLNNLVFRGFITVRFVEITEKENISQLKSDLVKNGALHGPKAFESITHRLRSILKVNDLKAGLVLRYRVMEGNSDCILRSVLKDYPGDITDLLDVVYGQVFETGEPYFIPEILECSDECGVVGYLYDQGIHSIGLIPLRDNDEVIAVLELASGQKDVISCNGARKISELLPGLSVAVRREMNYLESRVDSVIKEYCTAIHPCVAWRFEEAAFRYLRDLEENGTAEFEDIEFKEVFPLYGSMDIRSSSEQRNLAIQSDLLEQLKLASDTLADIYQNRSIPIADYYISTVRRFREKVASGLDSGDEISVIEFLQQRVEPFFRYIQETTEFHTELIEGYFDKMSSGMGIIYRQRKDYEESVSLVNTALSSFLEIEEQKAQNIFPHYFEKYRTDGVEYNIYVGSSMVDEFRFEDVQLKNMRIWQLIKMCEMSRLIVSLLPRMKVALACSPLILVHSAPLTIQFRADEKRFEVEGTYNIRYEIIKKRIDKSTILGTGERLTQPGKLSVIYTQDREWREYLSYFEYLADKGYVAGEVEHLTLEDLQGVHGLRALRVGMVE